MNLTLNPELAGTVVAVMGAYLGYLKYGKKNGSGKRKEDTAIPTLVANTKNMGREIGEIKDHLRDNDEKQDKLIEDVIEIKTTVNLLVRK